MTLVMCRQCGHFVSAVEREGNLQAVPSSCPQCGGAEFKDVESD